MKNDGWAGDGEEEWERPIGLTKEYAICLDDSDDEGSNCGSEVDGNDDESTSMIAIEKNVSPNCKQRVGKSTSSYFRKTPRNSNESVDVECESNDERDKVPSHNGSNASHRPKEKPRDGNTVQGSHEGNNPAITPNTVTREVATQRKEASEENNPFASFAFVAEEAASSGAPCRPNIRPNKPSIGNNAAEKPALQHAKNKNSHDALRKKPKYSHPVSSRTASTKNTDGISRRALTPLHLGPGQPESEDAKQKKKAERKRLIAKWHAFADPSAPIEQRRFQLLVAARLHARCQEQVVAKAMDRLRNYFDGKDSGSMVAGADDQKKNQTSLPACGSVAERTVQPRNHSSRGLTVNALASADPETEIAPLLSSVLFGNVKAKQIVQAAQDIRRKFGGKVPESMSCLKDITGIGPKLADILLIVNSRASYS